MNAGLLTSSVTIWRKVKVIDDFGSEGERYEVLKRVRCHKSSDSKPRTVDNQIISYDIETTFLFRRYTDIRNDDLIELKGVKFYVLSVNDKDDYISVLTKNY